MPAVAGAGATCTESANGVPLPADAGSPAKSERLGHTACAAVDSSQLRESFGVGRLAGLAGLTSRFGMLQGTLTP